MKMGIGIGWPNSTSSWGDIYPFIIEDCTGIVTTVYSTSSEFLPGAYVFNDPGLTDPFTNVGIWNLPGLIYSIGGYGVGPVSGIVKAPLGGCPT
jgi:hypothetical protein